MSIEILSFACSFLTQIEYFLDDYTNNPACSKKYVVSTIASSAEMGNMESQLGLCNCQIFLEVGRWTKQYIGQILSLNAVMPKK